MDWKSMFNQWRALLFKELRFHLYSLTGIIFILLFLIICSSLLWIIPGAYNIPGNGYATLTSFFVMAPVLFLFLIPALSMRSLADEKRMHTFLLLRSRPVTINSFVSAKIMAILIMVLITLLPTLIYVVFIYYNGDPVGNLDLGAVAASYIGLIFVVLTFISLSVFASSLTDNQVLALILGMFLCSFFYFAFDLLSVSQIGFLFHYKSIMRGLVEASDIFYFLMISTLFYLFTLQGLGESLHSKAIVFFGILCLVFFLLSLCVNWSYDWTKDKRYSLHSVSKKIIKEMENAVEIDLYLTGNLNSGFKRLQESTIHLLDDLNKIAGASVYYSVVDPYKKGKEFREVLAEKGMRGIAVNERLNNGRISQQILYPYALIKYGDGEIVIPLLVNQAGRSGEENLNLSVEMLEYEFIHAIDLLTRKESRRIAFLEGHGEFPEESITEIMDQLSYEYTIDRGILSGFPGELDEYDLAIIAGPHRLFNETDKFVLDQYLMHGGSLLWFVNGTILHSYQDLIEKGETMSMANDLNLNDFFFTYGIRINPVILQDLQSLNIPVSIVNDSGEIDFVSRPWYYNVLLQPNNDSEITKGFSSVKASFASTISLVGENLLTNKEVLLRSSSRSRTVQVPSLLRMDDSVRETEADFFRESDLPVAVLIKPPFESVFKNRSHFFNKNNFPFLETSDSGKMIVVSSEDILLNPLGYDPYSQTQFANREFILAAVNYLTDSRGIFALKNRSLQMQLLNKKKLQNNFPQIIFYNVILPPLLLIMIFIIFLIYRKTKYGRKMES